MKSWRTMIHPAMACALIVGIAFWGGRHFGLALSPEIAQATVAFAACGDGAQDPNSEQCDDGNLVYGDGCTPNCRLEENPLAGNCEDGIDNDLDELVDSYDPDCATLAVLQQFALISADEGLSGRRPGMQVGFKSVVLSSDPNALLAEIRDPNTLVPYPAGPSKAGVCGLQTRVRKTAYIYGNTVADGDIFFSAKHGSRPVVGGLLVHTGLPTFPTELAHPFVGPPVWCGDPDGGGIIEVACVSDADCPSGKVCIERNTYDENLADPNGGWVDPDGTGIGAETLAACLTAQVEAVELHDLITLMPGTDIDPANSNEILLRRGEERVDNVPAGNTVLNIERIRIRKNTTWKLVGEPGQEDNTNLLVQVARPFKIGKWAEIVLENLSPDRVLFNLQSDALARGKRNSTVPGTLLAPRRSIKIGYFTETEGAAIGNRVQLHRDGVLTHRPFIGLLDTDLSVVKASSVGTSVVAGTKYTVAGTPVTFTVTVTNDGPSNAHGVVLTDNLPVDYNFIPFSSMTTPAGLRCEEPTGDFGGTLTCYLDTLTRSGGALDEVVIAYDAHVDPSARSSSANDATVTIEMPDDYDTSNNSPSVTDLIVAEPDLEVASNGHTLSPSEGDPAIAGMDTVSYSFTVTNHGPSDAIGSRLNVPLPTGLTLDAPSIAAAYAGVSCVQNGNGVRCTAARLVPVGDEAIHPGISEYTVTFDATVDCNATGNAASTTLSVTATASVTAGDETDPDGSNNSATESVNVIEQADLGISKADAPDPVIAGDGLTYTVTVTNTQSGASDSRNINVNDTLPAGVTLNGNASVEFSDDLSGRSSGSCTNEDCTITRLACGETATITIDTTVDCDTRTSVTNNVALTSDTDQGNNALSNSASETTTVEDDVNLSITKVANVSRIEEGAVGNVASVPQQLTYTLTVTNNATYSCTISPTVTDDPVDDNGKLENFVVAPSQGSCSSAAPNLVCDLGQILAGGNSETITITANAVDGTGSSNPDTGIEVSNTASVNDTGSAQGSQSSGAAVTTDVDRNNGDTCVNANECASGNCVDGYCCNTDCLGTCEACNLSGSEGTCTPRPADDNTECGTCERCNGSLTTCQDVTAADGKNCTAECTQCSAGSCTTRSNGDTTECGTCEACDGTAAATCPGITAADGKGCVAGCTECNSGSCDFTVAQTDPEGDCSPDCRVCDGTGNCTNAADGTDPELECTDAFACTTDTCQSGACDNSIDSGTCLISGTCYNDTDDNPGNECQECVSATSQMVWTNKADLTLCTSDGAYCNGVEQCQGGSCAGPGDPCAADPNCTGCDEINDCCTSAAVCGAPGSCVP